MNALEWLKERQAQSERNRRLFENRPNTLRAGEVATHSMIPASQAWSGYGDRPAKEGGQRLMVRQPQPEVKNKLVQKRGDLTMTKEWVDNARFQKDSPGINITPAPQRSRVRGIPLPPNVYKRGFQPSPPNQAGEWARTTGMWDVPAKTPLSHADISNLRAMKEAEVTPTPPQQLRSTEPSEQYWNLRNLSGGYARQPRATIPEVVRASEGPSMEKLPGESIEEARLRLFGRGSPESPARETWGGDLNLTLPQHPRTRRWIQDPSTILNMGNLIKSMGRTMQGIEGGLDRYTNWWDKTVIPNTGGRLPQGAQDFMRDNPYFTPMLMKGAKALADKIGLGGGQVDDRLERNRIRRLMEHRTANPYYRGGLY